MPGPLTFLVGDFAIRPTVPESWSFSGLRDFEDCPMRWALSHIVISCFASTVPQKPSKSSVEGILLHELLERYDQYIREPHEERFRPRSTLLELLTAWERGNKSNLRINSKALADQVGIEDILRGFNQAIRYFQQSEHKVLSCPREQHTSVGNRAEVWLRDPESKLCGRADQIQFGEIIDFKTGDKYPDHIDQILFYAALHFALTGEAPKTLLIVYTADNSTVRVPLPTLGALTQFLSEMRQRSVNADKRILQGDLSAKPEPLKCARCHVRGLCDKYWESKPTLGVETLDQSQIVDYAPSSSARVELAAHGAYIRDGLDRHVTCLYIPNDLFLKAAGRPERIRTLSIRASRENEIIRLALTQDSEFYVIAR